MRFLKKIIGAAAIVPLLYVFLDFSIRYPDLLMPIHQALALVYWASLGLLLLLLSL